MNEPGDSRDIAARAAGQGVGNISHSSDNRGRSADIAMAIQERMVGRVGNPSLKANSGNISGIERGDSRDIAARAAGHRDGDSGADGAAARQQPARA